MKQITDTILMIRPAAFGHNPETAANNYFQQAGNDVLIHQKALAQFDKAVSLFRSNGINVIVANDTMEPAKPDAIFPNNWFTAHRNVLSVFPMFAQSRRVEKRDDIISDLHRAYHVNDVHDWSEYEASGQYLEGTGSMVIDHVFSVIYACISPRTNLSLLSRYGATHGFRVMAFHAEDNMGRAIYHTNVMLCIGERFAVICSDAIPDATEKTAVTQLLQTTGHELIHISQEQMEAFAGNMLQVKNCNDERLIVLSATAYKVLTEEQKECLQKHGSLLPVDVSAVETEGGSIRCMMAEIFLEKKSV